MVHLPFTTSTLPQRRANGPATPGLRSPNVGPTLGALFAPRACIIYGMSKSKRALGAILASIRQGPERSPLFWWMLDNYQDLAKAAEGTRIRWEPLRARFAELGLLDGAGKTPSAENARQTWLSVRQVVESREAALREKATARPMPSRLPATWRPQEATPPPAPSPFAPRSPTEVSTIVNNEDCTPEEALAGLRRILAERSGR